MKLRNTSRRQSYNLRACPMCVDMGSNNKGCNKVGSTNQSHIQAPHNKDMTSGNLEYSRPRQLLSLKRKYLQRWFYTQVS